MVSRRMVWGLLAAAAGALWLVRSARAGEVEAEVAAPAAMPERARAAPVRVLPRSPGYAAEAARNLARMPAEERNARAFLRSAAVSARFEIEASRLAMSRAQHAGLRDFASEQLQYHESTGAEIQYLLHVRAMAPPMLENAQRKALNRLARLSGPKFDREFMAQVGPRRQREDLALYQRAALGVKDPVLKGWIERQLPTLREQHAAVQRIGMLESRRSPRGEAARRAALPGTPSPG